MSGKSKSRRRVFDVEMPAAGAETGDAAAAEALRRRGPMATALGETASALAGRRAAEEAIRAENDALAHEHVRLKRLGLVIEMIPLEAVSASKLIRDRRMSAADPDLDALKASIREIGLSNPIRVEAVSDGGAGPYELVQGFRRLSAYRALLEETGDDRWARIPATLVRANESMEGLYRRMVDENLVRKDVSFAEMAALARAYADDPETAADTVDAAVRTLFRSAGYQKRSYIRAFAELMARLEKYLEFPEAIARNLGLALRARLEADPKRIVPLQRALEDLGSGGGRTAEAELTVLRRFAEDAAPAHRPAKLHPSLSASAAARAPAPEPAGTAPPETATRFTVQRPGGEARCTARPGRLEIRAPDDFAAHGPEALNRAVAAFYRALED